MLDLSLVFQNFKELQGFICVAIRRACFTPDHRLQPPFSVSTPPASPLSSSFHFDSYPYPIVIRLALENQKTSYSTEPLV